MAGILHEFVQNTKILASQVNENFATVQDDMTELGAGLNTTLTNAITEAKNDLLEDIESVSNGKASKDLSDITESAIETLMRNCMPDYTAGIAIGGSSNYIAPANGFVSYAPINNTSTANVVSQGIEGRIAINGYTVLTSAHQQNHDTAHPSSGFFLVGKGETIFHTMTAGTVYFYPCKGVN